MRHFSLQLASASRQTRIEDMVSFVGSDASGQFGLMADHAPMATVLEPGLARFRTTAGPAWTYLALPGGTLHFADNQLSIATRTFVIGDELARVRTQLETELAREQQRHGALRHNLDQLERALAQRLWELERT